MIEYITKIGMIKLNEKLFKLKESLPDITEQISVAREMGDLSENAEYHAARERKRIIENEIGYISGKLSRLQIIEPSKMSTDIVRFSFFVRVWEEGNKLVDYIVVGADEIDFDFGENIVPISFLSPLGSQMLGKKTNENFDVVTPSGKKKYTIKKIWS